MVIGQRVGEVTRVRIDRPLRPPTALESTVATEAADRICALPNHRETYFHCMEISCLSTCTGFLSLFILRCDEIDAYDYVRPLQLGGS